MPVEEQLSWSNSLELHLGSRASVSQSKPLFSKFNFMFIIDCVNGTQAEYIILQFYFQ